MNAATTVDNQHFFDDDGSAYEVRPTDNPVIGGVLFLHWFDPEATDGNRTQFLAEAEDLAAHGVVSLLPELLFPWSSDPTDSGADSQRIEAELERLASAVDWLAEATKPKSLIVVGHDFGAMHGALLMARDTRVSAGILMAPANRWGSWFLRFWAIGEDRIDYLRAMRRLDPIEHLASIAPRPLLLQFAENDYFIAGMDAAETYHAAREPKRLEKYGPDHALRHLQARIDRRDFILEHLRAGPRLPESA